MDRRIELFRRDRNQLSISFHVYSTVEQYLLETQFISESTNDTAVSTEATTLETGPDHVMSSSRMGK